VGREDRPSLTVLIALPDALDQYYMTHPDQFLSRGFEEVVFDPENRVVARAHLVCAAAETPIGEADRERYGTANFALVATESDGVLARDATGTLVLPEASSAAWHQPALHRYSYAIHDDERRRVIGSIDGVRAPPRDATKRLPASWAVVPARPDIEARKARSCRPTSTTTPGPGREGDGHPEVRGARR
jgi:DEAD/DEAH box helicase domain-containing protein